ncbi:hypothetical protein ACIPC1_12420 [Streptomyces sp. NPDC087263]|uniref:hypothetical protein n=1 Tax=Streptomyces sp. NPDC087263 TaxID=3365773 RepID=UPI0037FE2EE8
MHELLGVHVALVRHGGRRHQRFVRVAYGVGHTGVGRARDPRGTGDAAAQRRNHADVEGGVLGVDEIDAVVPVLSDVADVLDVADVFDASATNSVTATA